MANPINRPAFSRPATSATSVAQPRVPAKSARPNDTITLDDMFDAIAASEVSVRGNYLKDGIYEVSLRRITVRMSNKGDGRIVVVEFFVDSARPSEPDIAPNAEGSTFSQLFFVDKGGQAGEMQLGNFKKLLCAAANIEPELADKESLAVITREAVENNALAGVRLGVNTYRHASKKGTMLVLPNWTYIPQTEDEQAENAARIGL